MPYKLTRIGLYITDAAITCVTAFISLCLAVGHYPLVVNHNSAYFIVFGVLIALRLSVLGAFGIYRISSRHTSVRDLEVIIFSTLVSSVLFGVYVWLFRSIIFPSSAIFIDWFINLLSIAGVRLAYRVAIDEGASHFRTNKSPDRRILIFGAGAIGGTLAREIRRRNSEGLELVGFLDDDPAKRHMRIDGTPILGSSHDIRMVVTDRSVDEVIIAAPSAPGNVIRDLSVRCENLQVRLRVSPGFTELDNRNLLHSLHDVSVEDLLRRDPVTVNMKDITKYLKGERILITGAGGSIGSELVRQILKVDPEEIILLGRGENSVFEIEQELRHEHGIYPKCLIADIRDYSRLRRLFAIHRPTVVFHTAAHKHVPLMEANADEAIMNNIYGTQNLARIATESNVKRFVMISTDKAVNPTSMMGVSKRVAELVVQAESTRSNTEFALVRFGNVLGSRGSVLPLMRKQIERGSPVTVTHPDVRRYFMTIPEAVQLVIQAGSLGGDGNIYILDMGEPIRILDLARDLIRLSGLVPDKDVEIKIVGLRPGEKLFEELLTSEEGTTATKHERIFMAQPAKFNIALLESRVESLIGAAQIGETSEIVRLLRQIVPTYTGGDHQLNIEELATDSFALAQMRPNIPAHHIIV